jgi:type IV pilus assembly protein PilQ
MQIDTDGKIDRVQYFRLGAPPRLVVDLYGVKPQFNGRVFPASQGFRQVRVGTYADKTRFAYDTEGGTLPEFSVVEQGSGVVVGWGNQAQAVTSSAQSVVSAPTPAPAKGPAMVESIDFDVANGKSELIISLSKPGTVIEPVVNGNVVGFGVKNANISRALRRAIDASAFPSAVRRVTPYTVLMGDTQDVRFAVELKGPAPYRLNRSGNLLVFTVDNGAFAEPAPPQLETVALPVPQAASGRPGSLPMASGAAPAWSEPTPRSSPAPQSEPAGRADGLMAMAPVRVTPMAIGATDGMVYSGQKISLVFDDADIRNILQLIAEVSDLNIIASDDVKGTITLRLIDVPWDQALDLIMEIKGLGMIREGNVARILPKEKLRAMEESKLTAARTKEKLEDLATEVISVSYTGLANVAGPAKELLTERGTMTQDNRNKQIIVTDVPTVIEKVKQLITILDTPERQVLIDARIVEVNTNYSRDLGINWGISYQNPGSQLNNAAVGIGGDFLIGLPGAGGVGTAAGLASGITFGQLGIDKTVLNLRLSALEANGRAKVISNPRITTLNGEEAEISQGTTIPYQTVSQEGTKTEFVDAVLNLTVTPVINPDNSVILTIEATNDSPSLTAGAVAPSIDTKKAKTKVLVKDGETTVIGGIFIENDSDSDSGVPFLNKLPWIGHLFKSQRKSNQRTELMIFVTPRILN